MKNKALKRIFLFGVLLIVSPIWTVAETIGLFFDHTIEPIKFAANDVKIALEGKDFIVEEHPISSLTSAYANKKVVITLVDDEFSKNILLSQGGKPLSTLGQQAYGLRTTNLKKRSYWVVGGDETGAMYGGIELAESFAVKGYVGTFDKQEAPFMQYRGMKLNMPLDKEIPTYVGGWSSTSTKKAIPHVWDLSFWTKLIDQQARYRYNMLSVWVHHPFPALVKVDDYPKASLPRIEGFDGYVKELNHEQRVAFWRKVMQHAHNRGMKFYFFNWNIYVDYASKQYPDITRSQTNITTIDYTYKSMKALIETYPELDGFGISGGDGMDNKSTLEEKTRWTYQALGRAVEEYLVANPTRQFDLIHRKLGTSTKLWNDIYGPIEDLPNGSSSFSTKYAQAHMYSTTTPNWSSTYELTEIAKLGRQSWLTIRNDDYFYINWGDHNFVREYMKGIPNKEVVTGIYIGSDGYTPSRSYLYKDATLNNQLDAERRWYMEMVWGRISYNPNISNEVFVNMLAKRFPSVSASDLFQAWTLASRPLPKVTELIMKEWDLDFEWYPEACFSDPDRETGFRTIDDFANLTTVAKGSNLCDIPNSAAGTCGDKKSSYMVADEMQVDAERALTLINRMRDNGNTDLRIAINNIKQMIYLSLYYAHKVRGATYKKAGRKEEARVEMGKAVCKWHSYTRAMEEDYITDSFRSIKITPDWRFADTAVLKEFTDLGGIHLLALEKGEKTCCHSSRRSKGEKCYWTK